ncbi:MAG: DUF1116 domain-containing protein [Chloroflexi bacterium]|nr:DUF1116 domain-containing protein [Chloroflexota bacterium]
MTDLFQGSFPVVNAGLSRFSEDLAAAQAQVTDLHWRPPVGGAPEVDRMLADLADDTQGLGAEIRAANTVAFGHLTSARPVLLDIAPARDVLADMHPNTVLHAGPPLPWDRMVGAMQGAVLGGLLYEGLARSPQEAADLAASSEIEFASCHSRNAVGPMAGVITGRTPLLVVRDEVSGTTAFSPMNEGWGRALRFGAYDEPVIDRLRWMETALAPTLRRAVGRLGGIDVRQIIARALHMGDECHNRDIAASSLLFKTLAPEVVASTSDTRTVGEVLAFLAQQEHFFLNVGMAACKAALLAAGSVPHSTMVTAIARNGREVGITVSGAGTRWFTAPAPVPQGLFFPGFTEADASGDLGDSAITEAAGIGAVAMAAAPAIVGFVGGTAADAMRYTEEMYAVTLGESPHFTLPALEFRGTPTGLDVRAVLETGIEPVVNTGIAHREAGRGLVGAGVARVPALAFESALRALHAAWVPS